MSNCVNFNSPDVVKLAGELNVSPAVAAAKIGLYQDKNGLDKFPTVDELKSNNKVNYQKNQTISNEGIIASEKTIRDLAAKIADRIGMSVKFESDRSKEYKGKIENNVAYVNLAYATLDTPIHEILGHPIIRSLKNGKELTGATFSIKDISNDTKAPGKFELSYYSDETLGDVAYFDTKEEAEKYASSLKTSNGNPQLYQNLLKELETGKGKEVLDRIKRDYTNKTNEYDYSKGIKISDEEYNNIKADEENTGSDEYLGRDFYEKRIGDKVYTIQKGEDANPNSARVYTLPTYSLEEQQEEAIVELLGLMTAEKLDNVKDGKLISLLKRLLKEMKSFIRNLINQKEVEIDKLPDNMTINDLSDLLAYSNSKLILPGYEVEYTTPDNMKFKTYQEASNHISKLAKSIENVNLDSVEVKTSKKIKSATEIKVNSFKAEGDVYVKYKDQWYTEYDSDHRSPLKENIVVNLWNLQFNKITYTQSDEDGEYYIDTIESMGIDDFIEKNKEYEQSKEIIEEWKKVNNIQYNPEEIYSRGQEFSSVVGAYSEFDVNLMMQNLLSHIEDNEKAGGKFAISAYTKPVDKQIGHLEGGGGKIKFKLYPQSNDILWAANTDVYSGSVWDASEKVNKDKKSELLGVSYTKYPSLSNVNAIQPNLAAIVDDLNHHHNELGITLTGNNFRLEYDDDIPYTTKKIIDGINKILDQKYGKLVKPEISKTNVWNVFRVDEYKGTFNSEKEAEEFIKKQNVPYLHSIKKEVKGIQPAQTNETLKESIKNISGKVQYKSVNTMVSTTEFPNNKVGDIVEYQGKQFKILTEQQDPEYSGYNYELSPLDKPIYTSQAEINTKIAALKEVSKAQPRSLIRSEVKPVKKVYNSDYDYNNPFEDLPFQKIPSVDFTNIIDNSVETIFPDTKSETIIQSEDNQNHKLLFGDENIKTLSASKVLTNLISSDTFNNSKDEGFFLEKLMNLLGKSGANLKLITDKNNIMYQKFNSDTVMLYDSITNTIFVTDNALENFDKETLAAAFMHEVVHSTTVQAYFNPKNAEERMFKAFIDKAFDQYKHLSEKRDSKGDLMYGFTNQAEFIAEIYSNPEFRAEISNIEKNWLSKFIDEIRRIIGLIRNGTNNNLISSILLFETVDRFATADKSRWKGTLIRDPRYERFGKSEFAKQTEGKVKNLDDRLEKLLNVQKDNIAQVIRRAQSTNKKHNVKNQEFINSVKELEKQLHNAAETDKLKGINIYVDFMVHQIDKIKGLIDKGNKTEKLEVIERYKNYLGASDLLKPITDALTDTDIKDLTDEQQLYSEEILRKIGEVGGHYNILQSQFTAYINKELINELNDPYYSEIVIQEFRNSLAKEYPKDSTLSKNEWINEEVIKRQPELDKLIEEDKNQLIKGVSSDIDGADKNIFSVLDTKSRFIQVAWKMITKMQSKINELIRNYDFKLDKLDSNLKNEKGKYDVRNLFEKNADGQTFVKGEYNLKFRDKYINEYSVLLDKAVVLNKKLIAEGIPSTETHTNSELAKLHKELQKWRDANFKFVKGVAYPADKYKNDLNFSKAEKAIHDEYLNLVHQGVKQFGKDSSLLRVSLNANYYMIPYQTIGNLERLKEGKLNIVDFAKQKYTDITDWKIDEVENTEKMFTPTGAEIHNIPVLYRNRLTKKENEKEFNKRLAEQSVDLLTLMRLEFHNLTNHSEKTKNENVLSAMVETAKNKDYTKIDGNGRKILNKLGINNKTVEVKGIDSNTYKRLQSIVNQTLYNQFNEAGVKVLGKDINKITKSLISHTAFLGMTANYFSAPVNILNAEFQKFILKVGGDIKNGALSSAHKFYFADMPNILNDVGRPVNHSVTNQLNEIFDIFGGLTSVQQDFVKNTMLKSIVDPQMLQIMQSGGEHMVQSILNIALMKSVKVMNSENKYIDKNGKVVKEENAATLFDMVDQNKNTKQVTFSDKFTYTSLSTNTKFNEGGFENIKLYIKKKVSDTMGQHDKNYQSEYQKHWWGQLLAMYRKHVVPLGIARYRGAGKMFVNKLDLSEEDSHWNEFLQVNEEGYYTTFGRMIFGGFNKGIINGLQNLKYSVLSSKWNELSDYEKSNIRKATAEFSTLALLNFVIIPLLAGLGGNGDGDDDDYLVYLFMESRRLEQELGSYTDPNDAYKITKSPTATLSLINNSISVGQFVISGPNAWFSTNKKGESRFVNALEKVTIPHALRPSTTAKTALKQMNQGLNVPYNETIFYKLFNQDN